jgi:hypothetical protein
MTIRRRDFLSGAIAGACVPMSLSKLALAAQQEAKSSGTEEVAPAPDYLDQNTIDFWMKTVPAGKTRSADPSIPPPPDPTKIPEFLIYTDDAHGFRSIGEIQDSELIPSGDATVSLFVNQLRCSEDDVKKTASLKAAALRINMQQQKPLVPILGVLAYPLMAGIFSKNAKGLPALTAPTIDTGAVKLQYVPLPGGSAKWDWNVFAQHEQSSLGKFIQYALQEADQLAPGIAHLMSFPAATTPALVAIDMLWSYWQAKAPSHWLFNDVQTDVYATQDTKLFFDPKSSVPLVKGQSTYVLIPQAYLPEFKKSQNDVVVRQGFIVPKGTDPKDVRKAAQNAVSNVTYLTVTVSVMPGILTGPGASSPTIPDKSPSGNTRKKPG